jgi:hypothetical protein
LKHRASKLLFHHSSSYWVTAATLHDRKELVVHSAGSTRSSLRQRDNELKITLATYSTLALLAVVWVISIVELLIFGQPQIPPVGLGVFTVLGLCIIGWLGTVDTSRNLSALFDLLPREPRAGGAESNGTIGATSLGPGRFQRVITNLWIPVTFQFLLVGWLIYASGGMANSPYDALPILVITIGQSVYEPPQVEFDGQANTRGVVRFVLRLARSYWYPLTLSVLILILLQLAQSYRPMVTRPAPPLERGLTTFLTLFITMCVGFLVQKHQSRRR